MASVLERAIAMHNAGRPDQAEALLRRVLQGGGDGGDPRLLGIMASVLAVQGKHDQARHFFDRAFAAGLDTPALRTNLGNILLMSGKLAEAREQFEKALALDQAFSAAWLGLAPTLHQLGDGDGSIAAGRRAHELAPSDSSASLNYASALTGSGYIQEAIDVATGALALDPGNIKIITNYLMNLHYQWGGAAEGGGADPAHLYAEHRRLGPRFLQPGSSPRSPDEFPSPRDPDRPLRVGYLSADLRSHVVAIFARPMFEHRDRGAFSTFAYNVGHTDRVSKELQPLFTTWRSCQGLHDDALEKQILADRIDILVDLSGHTEGSRVGLLSRRLAPVQVTCIGYPDITGVPNVDWRIVDQITDPPNPESPTGGEKLYRLPRCFLCYTPPHGADSVGPLPALSASGVTFASFNAAPKISSGLLRLWGRLLARVPNSRLLLKNRSLASPRRREEVLTHLTSAGVTPDRIELIGWSTGFDEHLATYQRVDIGLDSLPYNGTTTTCEALWMGIPVVCLAGNAHVSRVGASLVSAIGLSELVATSTDAYIDLAAALAADRPRLAALRACIRERMRTSPLCDPQGYARAIDAAYRDMWRQHCARPR